MDLDTAITEALAHSTSIKGTAAQGLSALQTLQTTLQKVPQELDQSAQHASERLTAAAECVVAIESALDKQIEEADAALAGFGQRVEGLLGNTTDRLQGVSNSIRALGTRGGEVAASHLDLVKNHDEQMQALLVRLATLLAALDGVVKSAADKQTAAHDAVASATKALAGGGKDLESVLDTARAEVGHARTALEGARGTTTRAARSIATHFNEAAVQQTDKLWNEADHIFAVDLLAHVRSKVAKIVRLVGEVQKVIDDTDRFVTTTVAHPAQQVRDLLVAVQPLLNLVNSLKSLGIIS